MPYTTFLFGTDIVILYRTRKGVRVCVRYSRKWPIDRLLAFSAVSWAGHISLSAVGMFQNGPYQRGQGWRWWSGPTAAHTSSHYPSSQLRAHSAKIMNVERFCCFSLSLSVCNEQPYIPTSYCGVGSVNSELACKHASRRPCLLCRLSCGIQAWI
jgi:hypothetical protein